MRVKRDLVLELESPVTTTMQGLCLFGEYIGNQGKDISGWLYTGKQLQKSTAADLVGISFKLLFELGWNRDVSDQIALGILDPGELETRENVLWGCYVYDKLAPNLSVCMLITY